MQKETFHRVGPWVIAISNYEDWKPGYQIRLSDRHGCLDPGRTFKTVENAVKYARKRARAYAKQIVRTLDQQENQNA